MKKYNEPELNVLHIDKEIRTDIIVASAYNGETILAPGQRGLYDPYDAGY